MSKRMTEDELLTLTGNEIRQSLGYRTGKLAESRRRALQFYLARPVGELAPPEIEGRSTAVSTDVGDTIRWMLPNLIEVFAGGDSVVEFVPQKAGDEQAAEQATDYINYIFYRQNPGYKIIRTWILDAFIQKNGILKVWWDQKVEETREDYTDLSDVELSQLLNDKGVEAIEHTAKPDPLDEMLRQDAIAKAQGNEAVIAQIMAMPPKFVHDVAIKRTTNKSQVRIENVPPEEFLIARDAKSIEDARFCAHQVLRTISDLRAMGYKDVDNITSDDTMVMFTPERVERQTFNDEQGWLMGTTEMPNDPSQRQVWVTECYVRVDYDGDGIAEWRKVTRAGNTILDNTECDGPPFVSICPDPLPHQFFGVSVADLAIETQKQRTAVLRAALDNLYLNVNGRYFAVENQVNLDDLLTSRPGGVVRVKQSGAVGRLDQGQGNDAGAFQMMEYLETVRENATGWTRYSQGLNPDALQSTATGTAIVTQRADKRLELIAREFAETGFTTLFRLIYKLVCKHQNDSAVYNLRGKVVEVDPTSWRNQFDMVINVGLGTGDRPARIQQIMGIIGMQKEAMQIGLSSPKHLYNAAQEYCKLVGYKSVDKYFQDPAKAPPQEPKPDPEMQKAQAQMELEREKMQLQVSVEQNKQEAQDRQQQHQKELEAARDAHKAEMDAQLEAHRQQLESERETRRLEFERWKVEVQAQTQIVLAQIRAGMNAQPVTDTAPTDLQQDLEGMTDAD